MAAVLRLLVGESVTPCAAATDPIWHKGEVVTDLWVGDASDPPLESAGDVSRAVLLALVSGLAIAVASVVMIWVQRTP